MVFLRRPVAANDFEVLKQTCTPGQAPLARAMVCVTPFVCG